MTAPTRSDVFAELERRGLFPRVVRDLLERLGATLPTSPRPGVSYAVACPFHGEREGEALVVAEHAGFAECKGACGRRYLIRDLAAQAYGTAPGSATAEELRRAYLNATTAPAKGRGRESAARRPVNVAAWHACTRVDWADLDDDGPVAQLVRGWPRSALDDLDVGFVPAKDTYPPSLLFLVHDADGLPIAAKLRALTPPANGVKSRSVGPTGSGVVGLPQLAAKPDAVVVLASGEKDCAYGLGAAPEFAWTGVASGERSGLGAAVQAFRGRDVVILFDADGAGRSGAAAVAGELIPVAASVRIATLPGDVLDGTPQEKDVADLVRKLGPAAGDALRTIVVNAAQATTTAQRVAATAAGDDAPDTAQATTYGGGDDPVPPGRRDPESGSLVLSPRSTLPTAEAFVAEFHSHPEGRTLHSYAGALFIWRGNRYVEVDAEALRHRLQPWLHGALRYRFNRRTNSLELVPFESNPGTVKAALETLRAHVYLPASTTPPAWLDDRADPPDPRDLLPFPSGTLDLATGRTLPPTPALFNVNAIDFDYVPKPSAAVRWLKFLEEVWGDDTESIELLQEWMGYCLVADTSQQKMMLMVGPRRSGKGTIGRIQARLVGTGNVVGPTTSSLAGTFGLQPLIGKSLAIVSDARFKGENVGVIVERLLLISGEDPVTVDRKFLGGVTMTLPTRFVFLTNELPRVNDASGALAGRFLVLRLRRSFYGREDATLTSQLIEELPGILVWAIEGLRRLRARGYFAQPEAHAEAVHEMEDLSSPVLAFVRERCEVGSGRRIWVDDLYAAWRTWCEENGRNTVASKQVFGRDLAAAVPGVVCRRNSVRGRFYDGVALRARDAT